MDTTFEGTYALAMNNANSMTNRKSGSEQAILTCGRDVNSGLVELRKKLVGVHGIGVMERYCSTKSVRASLRMGALTTDRFSAYRVQRPASYRDASSIDWHLNSDDDGGLGFLIGFSAYRPDGIFSRVRRPASYWDASSIDWHPNIDEDGYWDLYGFSNSEIRTMEIELMQWYLGRQEGPVQGSTPTALDVLDLHLFANWGAVLAPTVLNPYAPAEHLSVVDTLAMDSQLSLNSSGMPQAAPSLSSIQIITSEPNVAKYKDLPAIKVNFPKWHDLLHDSRDILCAEVYADTSVPRVIDVDDTWAEGARVDYWGNEVLSEVFGMHMHWAARQPNGQTLMPEAVLHLEIPHLHHIVGDILSIKRRRAKSDAIAYIDPPYNPDAGKALDLGYRLWQWVPTSAATTAFQNAIVQPRPPMRPTNAQEAASRARLLLDKNRFLHLSAMDSEGNLIQDFSNPVLAELVFQTWYEGVEHHAAGHHSTARGMRKLYKQHYPNTKIPFFMTRPPIRCIAMVAAAANYVLMNRAEHEKIAKKKKAKNGKKAVIKFSCDPFSGFCSDVVEAMSALKGVALDHFSAFWDGFVERRVLIIETTSPIEPIAPATTEPVPLSFPAILRNPALTSRFAHFHEELELRTSAPAKKVSKRENKEGNYILPLG
ncbi:hypothetical protein EW146_g7961 [Bondarzewia mesenterica]|uniref:DUF6532 domain-containing protein n=1 Tax=Bondarzewia mesenterica TaxID=1095465 RepID=A0A4S4LJY2_9AGAM|nr:hypothetical protein EW146_g7961 [Bondarzewia mesenterica]